MRLLVLLLVLVPPSVFAEENDPQTEALLTKGDEFFQAKNYEQALVMYRAAEAVAKDKSRPQLMIGTTYIAENDCKQGMPYLQRYLDSKNKEGRSSVLRMMTACQASMAVEQRERAAAAAPAPAQVTPPHPVEQPAAPPPAAPTPQQAANHLQLCPERDTFAFCTADRSAITENEFVRRYSRITGRHDLDWAKQSRRNKVALGIFGATTGAGVVLMALSPIFANGGGFGFTVLMGLGAPLAVASAIPLIVFATRPADGKPSDHLLRHDEAQSSIDRYNRAIDEGATARPLSRVRILPYAGPGGAGVVGLF